MTGKLAKQEDLEKEKKRIDDLLIRIQALEDLNKTLNKENKELKELLKLKSEKESTPSWSEIVLKNVKKTQEQINIINTITHENREVAYKSDKVIISGIPLSEGKDIAEKKVNDKKKIEDLFEAIGVRKSDIGRVFRRTTRNKEKPALIVVDLYHNEIRQNVLKASKKLKDITQYKNVYINPDLTVAQQNLGKKLRDIRKEENRKLPPNANYYYGIRSDRVVKIYKKE